MKARVALGTAEAKVADAELRACAVEVTSAAAVGAVWVATLELGTLGGAGEGHGCVRGCSQCLVGLGDGGWTTRRVRGESRADRRAQYARLPSRPRLVRIGLVGTGVGARPTSVLPWWRCPPQRCLLTAKWIVGEPWIST